MNNERKRERKSETMKHGESEKIRVRKRGSERVREGERE